MNLQMQDMLAKVDRTPGVMAAVQNASATTQPASSAISSPTNSIHARIGESFAQALNRRLAKPAPANAPSTAAAPAAGTSLADLLNHQQFSSDDAAADAAQLPGESMTAYLNRHHATTPNTKKTTPTALPTPATAAPITPTPAKAKHAGLTPTETLNQQKETDLAAERHASTVKAAEGLVSNALILPVLKQLRRSPFGENSLFSGGNGEKAFGPEFDMQLSDRIAQSPRLGVKEALVRRLENRPTPIAKSLPHTAPNGINAASRIDVNG